MSRAHTSRVARREVALLAALVLGTAACSSAPPSLEPALASALAKYPDFFTLWKRTLVRSCGPNNGVCHNNRQSPDMQTPAALVRAIGQPCNLVRPARLFDNLCEPPGDGFAAGGFTTRVGYVDVLPSPEAPETVTISVRDPLPEDAAALPMAFIRAVAGLGEVRLAIPAAAVRAAVAGSLTITLDYAVLDDLARAPGITPEQTMARFLNPEYFVPLHGNGISLGDPNADGVFGADLGGALIRPGEPLKSYLFLRLLAPLEVGPGHVLTNVAAAPSTEPQMPVANTQYWDIDTAVPALWCWIRSLRPDGSNALDPIDYAGCSLADLPRPQYLGTEDTTWSAIYGRVLRPSCAQPCHFSGTREPTQLYLDDADRSYDRLLGRSGPARPDGALPYVSPGAPDSSLLYLKIAGAPGIPGSRMPPAEPLPASAVEAIRTWIVQGASKD